MFSAGLKQGSADEGPPLRAASLCSLARFSAKQSAGGTMNEM
jgi:hypothetical protein